MKAPNGQSENPFDRLDFLADSKKTESKRQLTPYKIIIADDDPEMHTATKILLRDFSFEDRRLQFIDVYSGAEAIEAIKTHVDAAIILLDVVMESPDSGLQVVNYIRKVLGNKCMRIILRTGQPGEAPEERIIVDYDINDYRLKTELTVQRLYTSMYEALRSYRDIRTLEHHKQGLEKIIKVSADMFSQETLKAFYNSILNQLMTFRNESSVYFRARQDGLVVMEEQCGLGVIIAATGRYEESVGRDIRQVDSLKPIWEYLGSHKIAEDTQICTLESGFLVSRFGDDGIRSYIFIEAEAIDFDIELMQTLMQHYSVAMDNYVRKILKD